MFVISYRFPESNRVATGMMRVTQMNSVGIPILSLSKEARAKSRFSVEASMRHGAQGSRLFVIWCFRELRKRIE